MKSKIKIGTPVFQCPSVPLRNITGHWGLEHWVTIACLLLPLLISGCQSTSGNAGRLYDHSQTSTEEAWIRDGKPIEFESELWYPADGIESFLDSEMYFVMEYKGIDVLIDKVDVRPYERLYTKFDRNKFRFFEKRISE